MIGIHSVGSTGLGMCPQSLLVTPCLAFADTLQRRRQSILSLLERHGELFAIARNPSFHEGLYCHVTLLTTPVKGSTVGAADVL